MDKIAVLIPCYNESKTIEKVVTDFKKVLPELNGPKNWSLNTVIVHTGLTSIR